MRNLFLLRHAHAATNISDFDRLLSSEGVDKCYKIAEVLKEYAHDIDLILCSSSVRTSQTIQAVLPDNVVNYSRNYYNTTASILLEYLQGVDSKYNNVVLVSHNSSISDLGSLLLNEPMSFSPGGLALFKCGIKDWSELNHPKVQLVSFWQ